MKTAVIFLAFAFAIFGLLGSMFILESPQANRVIFPSLLGLLIGLITYSGFIAFNSGAEDPDAPVVVASYSDELSASAVVVRLEAQGITARAIGGHTSTEVNSEVRVIVSAQDFEAAVIALELSPPNEV